MDSHELWNKVSGMMGTEDLTLSRYSAFQIRHTTMHLGFALAHYKFAVRMLANRESLNVLELGCNDGFGTQMLAQNLSLNHLVGVDFDEPSIAWARENIRSDPGRGVVEFISADFMGRQFFPHTADAVLSLDVIEHIPVEQEGAFLRTVTDNLKPNGVAIIGTPSDKMQPYASPQSKAGHVNNYSQERLYAALSRYFENVFVFGMTDEVLHTGFYPFCPYIMALACGVKQ